MFCLANPVGSAADFEQILTTENQPSPNGYGLAGTKNTEAPDRRRIVDFSAASVTSAVNGLKKFAIRVAQSPARGDARATQTRGRSAKAPARHERRVCSPERKLMNQHRDAIRDSRIATYFVEECLEPAIVATVIVLRNSAETADATIERIS